MPSPCTVLTGAMLVLREGRRACSLAGEDSPWRECGVISSPRDA